MKTFMKTALAAAMLSLGMAAQATAVIDDFSVGQALMKDTSSDAAGMSSTVAGAGILGGHRDLFVSKVGEAGDDAFGLGVEIGVVPSGVGRLAFNSDTGQNGYGIVRWDGAYFDPTFATIDATGLGGVNFSSSGNAFVLKVLSADAGFPFTINVYTDAANYTSLTLPAAGAGIFVIPFGLILAFGTDTGAGVNFSSIGALEAVINTGGLVKDVDLSVDIVQIPEPGSLALGGLALLALGAARRRRQAK